MKKFWTRGGRASLAPPYIRHWSVCQFMTLINLSAPRTDTCDILIVNPFSADYIGNSKVEAVLEVLVAVLQVSHISYVRVLHHVGLHDPLISTRSAIGEPRTINKTNLADKECRNNNVADKDNRITMIKRSFPEIMSL